MDPKRIYQTAKVLSADPKHKRLVLYSIGAVLIANILQLLLDTLITHLLQDATGLAALNKRSLLLTFQNVFGLALSLAIPFWSYGFTRVAMEISRKGDPTPATLLYGFRRFWPLLRYLIILTLMATGYALLASFLGTILFMLTPIADQAFLSVAPALEQAQALVNDPVALEAMMEPVMLDLLSQIWPMYLLIGIALCVILVPWLYQQRLAPYHLLDGDNGALLAMEKSRHEMHGNRLRMFLLDLRFWWYYGLQALALLPLYLQDYVGGGMLAAWGLTLLSLGAQFAVQWFFLVHQQTASALAYNALKITPKSEDA